MVVLGLMSFIGIYSLSLGPVSWISVSEVLPPKGVTSSIAVNWACISLISFVFDSMLKNLGGGGTFWVFAGFNALVSLGAE